MRTTAMIVWLTALAMLIASPANTLTKVREPVEPFDHLVFEGFCDFPVVATDVAGGQTQALVSDDEGNLVRIEIHGHLVTTIENPANGKSVTVNNSGPLTITFNDDGSLTVVQRGQSVSADQGLLTGNAFLIHHTGRLVTVAIPNEETGFVDFVSQERFGDSMDICAALS